MHLTKSDISQAAIVGLSLVASAFAVPLIVSGQSSPSHSGQTAHHSQKAIQQIQQNSD